MMKYSLLLSFIYLFATSNGALSSLFTSNSVESDYHGKKVRQSKPLINMDDVDTTKNRKPFLRGGPSMMDDTTRLHAMALAHKRQVGSAGIPHIGDGSFGNLGGNSRMGRDGHDGRNIDHDSLNSILSNRQNGRLNRDIDGSNTHPLISRMQGLLGNKFGKGKSRDNIINSLQLNEDNHLEYQNQLKDYLNQKNSMNRLFASGRNRRDHSTKHDKYFNQGPLTDSYDKNMNNNAKLDANSQYGNGNDFNNDNDALIAEKSRTKLQAVKELESQLNDNIDKQKINGKFLINKNKLLQTKLANQFYKKSENDLQHRKEASDKLKRLVDEQQKQKQQNEDEN